MFYNYQTGYIITDLSETEIKLVKREIRDIIYSRKWDLLFRPDIFNKILHIYYQNNQNSNFIQFLITYFNYSMIKMFSIWSICSLFNNVFLIPLLSVALILYKTRCSELDWRLLGLKLLIRVIALLFAAVYPSFLITSIIAEFGYILIFNKVNQTIVSYLNTRFNKYVRIFQHYTKYNVFTVAFTSYTLLLLHVGTTNCQQFFLTSVYIFASNDYMRNILVASVYGFGYLSDYNQYHILSIAALYYIAISIGQFIMDEQRDNIYLNKLNVNIFDSYYNRPENSQEIITKPSKMNIIDNYRAPVAQQTETRVKNLPQITDRVIVNETTDKVVITRYVDNLADIINRTEQQ